MSRPNPIDARGNQIFLGSLVRIVGKPDFSGVTPLSVRYERERVFTHVLGQCKAIDDIDQHGYVGMTFKIRKGQDAGIHCIWLEPHFVLVQKPNPSFKRDA
jgi:hypothetical protein